jgi:hypothetical protein
MTAGRLEITLTLTLTLSNGTTLDTNPRSLIYDVLTATF